MLSNTLSVLEKQTLSGWRDRFLEDKQMDFYKPVLRHGDLWHQHVLLDSSRISVVGVIDFEDIAIGDPAVDFATQLYLGTGFTLAVLDEYRNLGGDVDSLLRYRVEQLQILKKLRSIRASKNSRNYKAFEKSLSVLRKTPIFTSKRDLSGTN